MWVSRRLDIVERTDFTDPGVVEWDGDVPFYLVTPQVLAWFNGAGLGLAKRVADGKALQADYEEYLRGMARMAAYALANFTEAEIEAGARYPALPPIPQVKRIA